MAQHFPTQSQHCSAPTRAHAKRLLKPAAILIAALLLLSVVGYTLGIKDMLMRRQVRDRFSVIAGGLQYYRSGQPGEGRLPFAIRRARAKTQGIEEWLERNGQGEPLCSWRVAILPFVEKQRQVFRYDQPWNAPENRWLATNNFFYTYDADDSPMPSGLEEIADTNVMAITGPGTAFGDGVEPPMLLKDVPAQAILAVESRASGIPWPAPGDFDIRTMPQTINAPDGKGISSRSARGFHVIFADTEVWCISSKVPFETLKRFFAVAEAKASDREALLGPYALDRDTRKW